MYTDLDGVRIVYVEPKLVIGGGALGALVRRESGEFPIAPAYFLLGPELHEVMSAPGPVEVRHLVRPPSEWLRFSS